jgi:hypothetical protein
MSASHRLDQIYRSRPSMRILSYLVPCSTGIDYINNLNINDLMMMNYFRPPTSSQSAIYGIPPHARIPYPFHHLHPNNNLRPSVQEYGVLLFSLIKKYI